MIKQWKCCLGCVLAVFFLACDTETPALEPSGSGYDLHTLVVQAGGMSRTLFYKYDYYIATNTYTGSATVHATLEGLQLTGATVTLRTAHRWSVLAYYPDETTLIGSNYANLATSGTVTFTTNPNYYYTNTLRFRIYDHDDRKEIINADW